MLVKDLMTKNPITVGLDVEVGDLTAIFDTKGIHHLLVVENNLLAGVISDRDVLRTLSPFVNSKAETRHDAFTLHKKVHQIMTRKPVVIEENDSIKNAAQLILQHNVGCLPVLRSSKLLAGILTWRDLLKFAVSRTSEG